MKSNINIKNQNTMQTILKLTDNLIGLNGLGTYHGYLNPENYFDSYQIDEDFQNGDFPFDSNTFWEKFDWGLYMDQIVKQIDNQVHWLTSEINYHLGIDIIDQIDCVGINSPKYYNYRDDWYLLDFKINENFIPVLIEYAEKNRLEFSTFLKSNYSSYDGFISYTANNFKTWLKDFKEMRDQEIGAILSFVISQLDFNFIYHCLQSFELYYFNCLNESN